MGLGPDKIEHHAARHLTALKPLEDRVDLRQRLQLDIGLDLSLSGEGQSLRHVLAVPDKGAADGDAVGHDVEQGNRKVAWRQPDQHTGAALTSSCLRLA